MHSEIASIRALLAADGFTEPGPLPGRNLPHTVWAATNDGDAGLIPELLLRLMWTPPLEVVGSGKFGTPRERMQSAYLIPAAAGFDALLLALLGLFDDPQPAITSTPDTTATAIGERWRAR
jgi:hypothetical protein